MYLQCKLVTHYDGSVVYHRLHVVDDRGNKTTEFHDDLPVAIVKDSKVTDLREAAPFLAIIPCPYCGTANDRGHDPLKYVDKRLGKEIPK